MKYFLIIILLFGVNFTLYFFIGWLRIFDDLFTKRRKEKEFDRFHSPDSVFIPIKTDHLISPEEVAIVVPAYNEELVVADTIKSLLPLVPKENIFVNSFGSSDKTAEIASKYGVVVLNEEGAGRAKAEKLANTVKIIAKTSKYKAALFVDADTRISPNYLERALPLLSDPDVVSVAGYATTLWERKNAKFWNMFYVSYRERMYLYMQLIVKYAQTWRHLSVTPIVPGFASLYKIDTLNKIDINPPGLVIEDFNMTFEIHHRKLGKIAHHSSIVATTQDPDNFKDYFRQVYRWDLGFWQTVRRHGFWRSTFSLLLLLFIIDVFVGSLAILTLLIIFVILVSPFILGSGILDISWFSSLYYPLHSVINLQIFVAIFLIDYTTSIVIAISQKRPQYLLFGLGFLFLRVIDSFLYIYTLPKAFLTKSSGVWKSPTRR